MVSAELYQTEIDDRALKELAKAVKKNKPLEELLKEALRSLSVDRKTNVKRLTGVKPGLYRKRVESWRIIFAQSAKLRQVHVFAIRLRSHDTYKMSDLKRFASTLNSDFE